MPACKGATLSKDAVAEVLSLVPATQFVDGKFVLYNKITFGRSPDWAAAKPLAKALACLLKHTRGVQALQVPSTQGAESYFTVHQMKVKKNEAEACAFRLRALLSQLASQKAKGRIIPAAFVESFGVVMDLIVVSTPPTPRPPTATRGPGGGPGGGTTYSVSSSDDEMCGMGWDRSELLTSNDADLVALLQPEANADAEIDAEADAKKPDAEANTKDADNKKPDTKEADAKKPDPKEADTAALPAASPLANLGVQELMEKPLAPPGSDDGKGLQKKRRMRLRRRSWLRRRRRRRLRGRREFRGSQRRLRGSAQRLHLLSTRLRKRYQLRAPSPSATPSPSTPRRCRMRSGASSSTASTARYTASS